MGHDTNKTQGYTKSPLLVTPKKLTDSVIVIKNKMF